MIKIDRVDKGAKLKIHVIILGLLVSACSTTGVHTNGDQLNRILKNTKPKSLERENQLSQLCLNRSSSTACWFLKPGKAKLKPLSIIQGPSHSGFAQFNIMSLDKQQLSYVVLDPQTQFTYELSEKDSFKNENSSWKVENIQFKGLESSKDLKLVVYNQLGQLVDIRSFQVNDLKNQEPKIVLVSNLDDQYTKEQKRAWSQIYKKNPNYIFILGGGVIANQLDQIPLKTTHPDVIWHRYTETRQQLKIYYQKKLIPVVALWGEEDYGLTDAGEEYIYKSEALKVFKAFYPQNEIKAHFSTGPANSYYLNYANNNFFFLDSRSFRTKDAAYNEDQSHFGDDQLEWIEDLVSKNQQNTWFLSSTGFFANYHPWSTLRRSHPLSYKKFLNIVNKIESSVVFASSSRKLFEVSKVELRELHAKTYEITTGALHGMLDAAHWSRYPNSSQVVGKENTHHFVEIDLKKNASFELKMSSVDKNGRALYKKVLKTDVVKKRIPAQQAKR